MESFLHIVAKDLLQRFGTNMKNVTVVFPGKRANMFLNHELARLSSTPIWAPRHITIGDLFGKLSEYEKADPIDSICTLYQIYQEIIGQEHCETLDQFYGWGEIIISDFDDIDKHMADAAAIFKNVYELKELESIEYLEAEQIDTLRHFFQNFSIERNSLLKERFLQVWGHMHEMYSRLKEEQKKQHTLFEGAAYRIVAEKLEKEDVTLLKKLKSYGTIVFVGFNVLNKVERTLMSTLQKEGKALFYWDYDKYYVENPNNEAGIFMRQNLMDYHSALNKEHFDNLKNISDITFISTNNNNVQARYVHDWLLQPKNDIENRNAVILCDENLLQPVLQSFPGSDELKTKHNPNITMGFPLTDTPIYSLVNALYGLQTDGWDKNLQKFRRSFLQIIEHHPYASYLPEGYSSTYTNSNEQLLNYLIEMVDAVGLHFSGLTHKQDVYDQLNIEAIFQTHLILQKFLHIVCREERPLMVEPITLRRLLRKLLSTTNIPFHGEPAMGIQVMGVLETRCLDFSHMLILSLEEGNLPKGIHSSSMIPASLREAFHLTTIKHKISIYAYYFYRLIQRSEHITCMYNQNCVGTSRHEMSRFLLQLQAETDIKISTLQIEAQPEVKQVPILSAPKTQTVIKKLIDNFVHSKSGLSPTAINTFLNCPLKFYFSYVAGMWKNEKPEDGITASLMGTIFHETAQLIYEEICRRNKGCKTIDKATLNNILSNKSIIHNILDITFDTCYFHPIEGELKRSKAAQEMIISGRIPQNEYAGELIIIRKVLIVYLENLLKYDMRHAPFTLVDMEQDRFISLPVETPEGPQQIKIGGRIDRMDILQDGTLRIIDYKTGAQHFDPEKMTFDNVFLANDKHNGYYLQAFLYATAQLLHETNIKDPRPVQPCLFYVTKANKEDYEPTLKLDKREIDDFTDLSLEYLQRLKEVVEHIFSTKPGENTFNQCESDSKFCSSCAFTGLCGRNNQ